MSDKMSPNDINIGRLHAKIDALTAERDSALKRADDADVGWSEAALSWLQRVDEVSVERDSALARLKVAEDALDVLYAEASMLHSHADTIQKGLLQGISTVPNSTPQKNFDFSLPRVRKALRKSEEALTAIRADASPAKAVATCPLHGKTECCCG